MTTERPLRDNLSDAPAGPAGANPLAGISTAALRREIRARKRDHPGRDARANPVTSRPGAGGNLAGRYKENIEFLGVVGQMIRAAGRRVGGLDIALLGQLHETLTREGDRAVGEACWQLIRHGVTWVEIGAALGMKHQSAWEKYAKYRPADMPKNPDRQRKHQRDGGSGA